MDPGWSEIINQASKYIPVNRIIILERILKNLTFVWDYDLDEAQFRALLDGKNTIGRLDSDWAAIRLLEYASYPEIVHLLGFKRLIKG